MKQLKFSNLVFNDGVNLTVRRGVKWSLEEGVVCLANPYGDNAGEAEIISTLVTPFTLLISDDLVLEHDPSCRTFNGLRDEMKRVYPGFDEREIVTLVFFRKIISEQNPDECDAREDAQGTTADNPNLPSHSPLNILYKTRKRN